MLELHPSQKEWIDVYVNIQMSKILFRFESTSEFSKQLISSNRWETPEEILLHIWSTQVSPQSATTPLQTPLMTSRLPAKSITAMSMGGQIASSFVYWQCSLQGLTMVLPWSGQKWKAAAWLLLTGSVQIPWIFQALAVWGRWLCRSEDPCLLSFRALLKILSHQECHPQPVVHNKRETIMLVTGANFSWISLFS